MLIYRVAIWGHKEQFDVFDRLYTSYKKAKQHAGHYGSGYGIKIKKMTKKYSYQQFSSEPFGNYNLIVSSEEVY